MTSFKSWVCNIKGVFKSTSFATNGPPVFDKGGQHSSILAVDKTRPEAHI